MEEESGRMEKLRHGGSSGELPIDMQRTVGEINPRHYLQYLRSLGAYVLQCLTQHTEKSRLFMFSV